MLMTAATSRFMWRRLLVVGLVVLLISESPAAGQTGAPKSIRTVRSRDELRKLQSWTDVGPVDVVRPGRGRPTRIERGSALAVTYRPGSHHYWRSTLAL